MSKSDFPSVCSHGTSGPRADEDRPDFLTIEEAAALTRSSYGVIYRAIRKKQLAFGRSGRRLVIRQTDVLRWVMAPQRAQSASAALAVKGVGVPHV